MVGVTMPLVERAEAQARGYGSAYLLRPPLRLLTGVVGAYSDTAQMMDAGAGDEMRRLHRARGQLAGLIALLFAEAERPKQVTSWLMAAEREADAAGDAELGCWVTALLAQAACDERALLIAGGAIDVAAGSVGGVLAEAVRTVAWAERGQSSEALASLRRADEAYERLGKDRTGPSMLGYPAGSRHQHRADAHAALRMAVLSRHALVAALDAYPDGALRARAEVEIGLARCDLYEYGYQVARRRVEAALAALPDEHRTARLGRLARELPDWVGYW
jgi:hypothetical protein